MKSVTTAVCACALFWPMAVSGDEPRTARVAGIELPLDEQGRPAAIDAATRDALLANLRAQFAQRGVPAETTAEVVESSGHRHVTVGLDRTLITVARLRADGELETRCVQGAEEAADFLAADEAR